MRPLLNLRESKRWSIQATGNKKVARRQLHSQALTWGQPGTRLFNTLAVRVSVAEGFDLSSERLDRGVCNEN